MILFSVWGLLQSRFDVGEKRFDQNLDAGRIRMNPVRLVQFRHQGNPFQKEGVIGDVVPFGQKRVDGIKGLNVVVAKVAWRPHPRQQDLAPLLQDALYDPVKVVTGHLWWQPAQGIIAPQRNDDQVRGAGQGPVQPRQGSCGCISGDAGIADLDAIAGLFKGLLQLLREGIRLRQAIARSQAVTESDKTNRAICCIIGM